jgi:hypothetical protein
LAAAVLQRSRLRSGAGVSIVAIAWAKSQRTGSPTLKAVLMAVADYADERGCAWPSQARLMQDTELSERAVRGALSELATLGFLRREHRRRQDGSRATDILWLGINRHDAPVVRQDVPELPAPDAAPPAPRAPLELPINSSSEPNGSGAVAPSKLTSPKDRIWTHAHELSVRARRSEQTIRSFIGKLISEYDANIIENAIIAAIDEGTGDPCGYITRILKPAQGAKARASPFPVANAFEDFDPKAMIEERRRREQQAAGAIQ